MRILHTSDWHLGQYFYGKSREREHKQFIDWLLEQVSALQIDAVIVAGDVFDTANPPSYARSLYFDFLAGMSAAKCQVIVLAGNHDSPSMLGESTELLKALNCYVIPTAKHEQNNIVEVFKHNDEGIKTCVGVVCAIPFIRPRDVLSSQAGQSATDKQNQLQNAIAGVYQEQYNKAKELVAERNLPIVGTGHLTAIGASLSDSVREIYIGTLDAFPADAFPAFDYLALGHIHQSQKIAKSDIIRYCGSPIPLSFDEAKQSKFVHLVDVSSEHCNVTRSEIPRYQVLLCYKGSIESLAEFAAKHTEDCTETVWLDIEVESQDYHHDIQSRIEDILTEFPVEILRVRREKMQRMALLAQQEKVTLDELEVNDVFEQRLALEPVENDEASQLFARERLSKLYGTLVERVQHQQNHTEHEQVTEQTSMQSSLPIDENQGAS